MSTNKKKFLIVGAGLSGCVLANRLAKFLSCEIDLIDKRSHIGGNCYTKQDEESSIHVHQYGPHIFNSSNQRATNFWQQFVELVPYTHSVKAIIPGKSVYQLPINLHTINQFFNSTFSPKEAADFISSITVPILNPSNFEEQALSMVGQELYEAFFKGYTQKQWGVSPTKLPASLLKRIPLRFNYDNSYYKNSYSAIPRNGYTELFWKLIDSPCINLALNTEYDSSLRESYDHIFYSGPIDLFYNYRFGDLSYRTVYWKNQLVSGDYQGNSQSNYPSLDQDFTRVIEHKYFMPWLSFDKTIVSQEYSIETDRSREPFYPKRLESDMHILSKYSAIAMLDSQITFMGRLGTYRYLDMWKVTLETLELSDTICKYYLQGEGCIPTFSSSPY